MSLISGTGRNKGYFTTKKKTHPLLISKNSKEKHEYQNLMETLTHERP